MDKSPPMKNIAVLLSLFFSFSNFVEAQTYEPLVPGGDYACITFPDGTVKLGKANPDGYSLISEDRVKSNLNKRLDSVKGKILRLKEFRQEINKEGAQPKKDIARGLKAYNQLFLKGEMIDEPASEFKSKEEQLALIDLLLANLKMEVSSVKFQIKTAGNCEIDDPIVPAGSIKMEIVNAYNGVAAVLFAKPGDRYYTGGSYCVRGSDGVIMGSAFQISPCLTMDCSKKGYIGISLYSVSADHAISTDERASYTSQVLEKASGAYEVKRLQYKNYEPLTCEQTLD